VHQVYAESCSMDDHYSFPTFGFDIDSGERIPSQVRMLLFWFQFLSLFTILSSSWPPVLESFLNFTNVFNLDIGYLGMGCDISSGYLEVLMIKILLPVIVFLSLASINYVRYLMKRTARVSRFAVLSKCVYIVNFFSIQLLSSLIQPFNCVQSGGKLVMAVDPSVECLGQSWNNFIVFDVFFVSLYFVLTPAILICKFRHDSGGQWHEVVRPLVQGYRPGAEWFEIVRFLFRVSFVLIRDTLNLSTEGKGIFLTLILLSVLWIESRSRPYANPAIQDLSML
jgi:uncharacterized membrane protein